MGAPVENVRPSRLDGPNSGSHAQHLRIDPMKKVFFATALLTSIAGVSLSVSSAQAANVPCEEMLKDMRAAKATATLSEADMAKVNELETKAVERCNADDDARSDGFLKEAMTIMGK